MSFGNSFGQTQASSGNFYPQMYKMADIPLKDKMCPRLHAIGVCSHLEPSFYNKWKINWTLDILKDEVYIQF